MAGNDNGMIRNGMRILYVSSTDLAGSRFNGLGLASMLRARGHDPSYLVWNRDCQHEYVASLRSSHLRIIANSLANLIERQLSIQSLLSPASFLLSSEKFFKAADVVHYQLIHSMPFFSLLSLPRLTRLKPSVWTLHDPWALTGHCIHPESCTGWESGCRPCPHLDKEFRIKRDTAGFMFRTKQAVYSRSSMDIVVASNWMRERVQRSPLLCRHRVHVIPFGIDTDVFKPRTSSDARRFLHMQEDAFVILLRSSPWSIKGLPLIKEALHRLKRTRPIHLLTVDRIGGLGDLYGQFPTTELGWVENPTVLASYYSAADILLMPSHESFGMMALEAAACGVPTICLKGSAVEEICRPPEGGMSIPEGEPDALAAAIETAMGDEARLRAMGERARALALSYTLESHVTKLLDVYAAAMASRAARSSFINA